VKETSTTPLPWSPRPVTVALAQFAMTSDPAENLTTAINFIHQAAHRKAHIVCLPELFRSPYFCTEERASDTYAEAVPGEVGSSLCKVAKDLGIAIVTGSVYEKTPSGELFNTSMVIDAQGNLAGTYRKIHIPHDPSFFEKNYFKPGDEGFKVFDLGFAKVGVLICYDQWFPEAARAMALAGAEILFYPTAIARVKELPPFEGDWQHAWQTVQCGHAVANNVVVCAVNRVGTEGSSMFWGGSFVCNAFGQILAKGTETEGLIITDVDLGHSAYTRESWGFFTSRRPECYASLTK
jgi:predicted amidohydrolase